MVEIAHVIADSLGLHARPVTRIASEAARWESEVTVCHDGRVAPACDVMALMGLEAAQGDTIAVRIEGPDERDAKDFFEHLLRDL